MYLEQIGIQVPNNFTYNKAPDLISIKYQNNKLRALLCDYNFIYRPKRT